MSTSATLLGKLWDPSDGEAWQRFVTRYQPLIYAQCFRLLQNRADAEDMTGTVLLKLTERIKDFHYDPGQSFRQWLRTVIANSVRDWWRRQARQPRLIGLGQTGVQDWLDGVVDPGTEKGQIGDFVEGLTQEIDQPLDRDLQLVHRALACVRERVKPRRWKAFWETVFEGRKAAEVAEELDLDVGAVYVAKNQIHKMVRSQLEALQHE